MLILLPPSEGKAVPRRGQPLDLDALSSPALTDARRDVLDALVALCRDDQAKAAEVLGLSPGQADLVQRNAALTAAPTARADRIYTGVLYDALDVATLSAAAKRRATARVAVASSLFGMVRLADRIPSYRLSGDASLPRLGPVAAVWREALPSVMTEALGRGLLVDLRSGMYAGFWRPGPDLARRVATVRVLHEHNGTRKVVSHFNKATKGRIVRALLEDGADPRTPAALAEVLERLGWTVEVGAPGKAGTQLDVVVSEL
ncbi:peroxide stress protein YaaA [Nocardioides albidus]|uniref:Peroxide stress protein YaaA n=1 Tax=Nocardioides albidus TaxID=1517589 RepID=A0A5C4WLD5_9ACTN|nr:peroxide stress protein YaaA [Nocardioides albidus]TNM48306.1 peroxide stress protein YaaA [Nocardioides albidus]